MVSIRRGFSSRRRLDRGCQLKRFYYTFFFIIGVSFWRCILKAVIQGVGKYNFFKVEYDITELFNIQYYIRQNLWWLIQLPHKRKRNLDELKQNEAKRLINARNCYTSKNDSRGTDKNWDLVFGKGEDKIQFKIII